MAILGIIPARGGSKGIPRKNIAPLGGRPLIDWTIAAARSSALDRFVVSTDDDEIAAVARSLGAEVPVLRPAEFAGDEAPALPVIRHMLDVLEERDGYRPDAVIYLQPTSPFRQPAHVDAAIALLQEGADTVVSVVPVPHNMVPTSLMRMEGEDLVFCAPPEQRQFRRQDKETLFARNGPAILAIRTEVVRAGQLYGTRIRPLPMDRIASLDIDEPLDLAIAERLADLTDAGARRLR